MMPITMMPKVVAGYLGAGGQNQSCSALPIPGNHTFCSGIRDLPGGFGEGVGPTSDYLKIAPEPPSDLRSIKAEFKAGGFYTKPTRKILLQLMLHFLTALGGVSLIPLPGGAWFVEPGLILFCIGAMRCPTAIPGCGHALFFLAFARRRCYSGHSTLTNRIPGPLQFRTEQCPEVIRHVDGSRDRRVYSDWKSKMVQ